MQNNRTTLAGLMLAGFVFGATPATAEQAAAGPAPGATQPAGSGQTGTVDRLRDRGEGVATSMFGTYIRRREFLVYPYYEFYLDNDYEYKPAELGFAGDTDYRGRYRAHEYLLWVGYGLTENVAVEFEAAGIDATLDKAATDPSGLPATVNESGLGDVEAQLRWRWARESDSRPEVFSFFEAVFPHQKEKPLIGTPGWELKYGMGLIRGFSWGTLTTRLSFQYEEESDSHFGLGEYAIEYLRRVSPSVRLYAGIEGTDDEVELLTELQWHLNRHAFIKFNNGIGLTSKAVDWAPEIGVVLAFGGR